MSDKRPPRPPYVRQSDVKGLVQLLDYGRTFRFRLINQTSHNRLTVRVRRPSRGDMDERLIVDAAFDSPRRLPLVRMVARLELRPVLAIECIVDEDDLGAEPDPSRTMAHDVLPTFFRFVQFRRMPKGLVLALRAPWPERLDERRRAEG